LATVNVVINFHVPACVWEHYVLDILRKTAIFWDVMRFNSMTVYIDVSEEPADSIFRVGQLSGNHNFPDNWSRTDVRNIVQFRIGVAEGSRGLNIIFMIIHKLSLKF
jgi:hypothetical protein